jgi:hypothetical protein
MDESFFPYVGRYSMKATGGLVIWYFATTFAVPGFQMYGGPYLYNARPRFGNEITYLSADRPENIYES